MDLKALGIDLSNLKLDQIKPALPFLYLVAPETLKLGNKLFPLREQIRLALVDGDFDAEDLTRAVGAWLAAPEVHGTPAPGPVTVPPPAAPGAPTTPPVTVPPRPVGGLNVAALVVKITRVTVSEPGRTGDARTIPFDLVPGPDGRDLIVLQPGAGHDHLDDGSKINLDAGVEDMDGDGILIDAAHNPELLGKLRWRARDLETGELLGQIGGAGMEDNEHIEGLVHFVDPAPPKPPGQWRRSGGMSVTAAVRAKCGFEVGFDGGKLCLGPITPKVN